MNEQQLVELGTIETSTHPFVQRVKQDLTSLDERIQQVSNNTLIGSKDQKFVRVRRAIALEAWLKGHYYVTSALQPDLEKESLGTALMIHYFNLRSQDLEGFNRPPNPQLLVIPIDDYFKYQPDNPSFVSKMQLFNKYALEQKKEYLILLSDFANSKVFTTKTLEQIPLQDNAFNHEDSFAQKINTYSYNIFKALGTAQGNVSQVISEMDNSQNARLLLATSLLLNDRQAWQNLWYENSIGITTLFIVAPASFHDSMNRLNMHWGHGRCDYQYRAVIKDEQPLFDSERDLINYYNQGLSKEEFRVSVEPLL